MTKCLGGLAAVVFAAVALTAAEPAPTYGKHYLLLVHETPEEFALRTDPAKAADYWKPWKEYTDALTAAGVLRGGLPLMLEASAKTVTAKEGKPVVADGPAAPAKPQLTGVFIIEVDTPEAAQAWAAKVPNAATRPVEVRPAFPAPMPPAAKK